MRPKRLIVFKLNYLLHKKTASNVMMIPTNNKPDTESPTTKPSVKRKFRNLTYQVKYGTVYLNTQLSFPTLYCIRLILLNSTRPSQVWLKAVCECSIFRLISASVVLFSDGSKGALRRALQQYPIAQNALNVMQFFGNFGIIVCWHPPGASAPLPTGNPGSVPGRMGALWSRGREFNFKKFKF